MFVYISHHFKYIYLYILIYIFSPSIIYVEAQLAKEVEKCLNLVYKHILKKIKHNLKLFLNCHYTRLE